MRTMSRLPRFPHCRARRLRALLPTLSLSALSLSALSLSELSLSTLSLSALALSTLLACDPFGVEFGATEPAQVYHARAPDRPPQRKDALVVMTYNVKFGGARIDFFFDCHGNRVLMSQSEVLENLDGLAAKIRQADPDVVFLQEVDINSKRSAFVDQMQYLLDHTALNHAVYASQWRADFVPSDGIGAVDSGNAIASKHPLHEGTRIQLALRRDQGSLEKYFYLRRNLVTARLDAAALGEPLWLVGIHAEAYAKDGTKRAHIERFEQELDTMSERGLALGGGDLNTLPPGTNKLNGFDDSVCEGEYEADDFSEETEWLESLYANYEPAIELDVYQANNDRYFTHTTSKTGFWNRKLDYLFTNGDLSYGLVHQDEASGGRATMPLSDHAPLSATLRVRALPTTGSEGGVGPEGGADRDDGLPHEAGVNP
jgi:endonuclease/exonuclease/phosphatase family metal-dependent hydrolase